MRLGLLSLFLVSFGTMLPGVAPHITAGDAGELALAGYTLGIPHPPGYPVFAILQHAFATLVPLGNDAYRQNLASAVTLSGALVMLAILLVRLTGQRWTLALPALLLTAPLFRTSGQVTEVFPLAFFWASMIFLLTLVVSKRTHGIVLLAFLFGLGATIHQTVLLMAPAVAFYFLRQQPEPWAAARRLALPVLAAFAGGLTIYLYLPLRSSAQPVLDWEDPQTLRRFWDVVTRARYGFLHLAQGNGVPALSARAVRDALAHARRFHIDNLGWTGTLFLAFGSLHSLARRYHRRFMATCWLHIFFTGPFFFWFAGVPFGGEAGVLSRFGLLPLAGSLALIALGLAPLWSSKIRLYRIFMVALLAAFFVEAGVRNRASTLPDLRRDFSVRETALNTLRTLPNEAVLLADRADETEFSLAYLVNGEGRRPGVRFTDCNAGVSKSIYGDDYYRVWGKPRLRAREHVESVIVSQSKVPVYYATVDPAMIDVYRVPVGLLYRALPLSVQPKADAIPWHRLLCWRASPSEPRSRALYRTDLDLEARDLFEKGQFDGALMTFGLIERHGGPSRWEQMAYWFQVRGEVTKAQAAYEKAAAAGDESEAFFSNQGAMLTDLGKVVPAIELYERGLRLYPDSVKILYNLAVARWETGSVEEARRLAQRVLAIEPFHVDAQRLLTLHSDGTKI